MHCIVHKENCIFFFLFWRMLVCHSLFYSLHAFCLSHARLTCGSFCFSLFHTHTHTHIFSSFKETVVASLKQPQNISLPLCLWQSILVYKSSFSKCWTTSFPKVVEATFTILKFMLYIPWKFLLTLILMGEKGFRISLHFIFKVVCLTFFLIGSLFFSFLTFVVPWHFLHYLFLCIFWVNYMVFLVF